MTIQAKYESRCPACNCIIRVGEDVEWVRGTPARHKTVAQCGAAKQKEAARRAAQSAPAPKIDLTSIVHFITAAKDRGLKRPKVRVLAPDKKTEVRLGITTQGNNPGSVSVVVGGTFIGCVRPDGTMTGARTESVKPLAQDDMMQRHLLVVAENPAAAAKEYAAVMCVCSFCGKALTDAGSVEVGYGPVCAKHWGLPHTALGTTILAPVPERQ